MQNNKKRQPSLIEKQNPKATKHFALIGGTLKHSYSKHYFDQQHFADADYRLCPMPSLDALRRWVAEEAINGFNITNPYKQEIIPLLDALSPEAAAIGAVNCVVVEGSKMTGHNTDAPAFLQTLKGITNQELRIENFSHAYILGTGGAAQAVAFALRQLGVSYLFVSRTPEKHENAIGYNQLTQTIEQSSNQAILLINATPVGTYPDIDSTPFPFTQTFKHLDNQAILVYDLVYNPSPTRLLREAATRGAQVKDGLEMLHRQAELSWQLWQLT